MKRVVLATLMLLVLTTSLAAQRIAEKVNGDATLSSAFARGLMYLTDQDARPESSSSSVAHLGATGGTSSMNSQT